MLFIAKIPAICFTIAEITFWNTPAAGTGCLTRSTRGCTRSRKGEKPIGGRSPYDHSNMFKRGETHSSDALKTSCRWGLGIGYKQCQRNQDAAKRVTDNHKYQQNMQINLWSHFGDQSYNKSTHLIYRQLLTKVYAFEDGVQGRHFEKHQGRAQGAMND